MKFIIFILLVTLSLSNVSAQRMPYGQKDSKVTAEQERMTLTVDSSIDTYVRALELTQLQRDEVEDLLKKMKGTKETWEQKKKRFDHQLEIILTDSQYKRYRSLHE